MSKNYIYTVSNTICVKDGIIPIGAIIEIKKIHKRFAYVSVKPFITKEQRLLKNLRLPISFIKANSTKQKQRY